LAVATSCWRSITICLLAQHYDLLANLEEDFQRRQTVSRGQ
jgi:hypothetical protein